MILGEETFKLKIGGQEHRLRGTFQQVGDRPVADGEGHANLVFEVKTVMLCDPHDAEGHHPLRVDEDPANMPRLDNTLTLELSPGVFRDVEWWQTVAKTPTTRPVYEYRLPGTPMTVYSEGVENYGECYGFRCSVCGSMFEGYPAQVGARRRIADAYEHAAAMHS